jgi:hypothetical protein
MQWLEYVVGRVVKGPAEEVGGSLTPREDDLFDQYNDEKSARSGFPERNRFIHHVRWEYPLLL